MASARLGGLIVALVLAAATAQAQTFEYLSMTQGLSDGDTNVRTQTVWQGFFAPVGVNSSGMNGTFKISDTAEVQIDLTGLGNSSFNILDITKPPQVPVLTFNGGSLHQMLLLVAGNHYYADAEAVGSGVSSLQFSMMIVPEPSGVWLGLIGTVMAVSSSYRRRFSLRHAKATYTVSTYDPVDDSMPCEFAWRAIAKRASKWGLRRILRQLYNNGYDRDASILVERNYTKAELEREQSENVQNQT